MRLFGIELLSSGRIGKLFDGVMFVPRNTEAAPLDAGDPVVSAPRESLVDFSISAPVPQDAPAQPDAAVQDEAPVSGQSAQAFIVADAVIFLSTDTDLLVFSPSDVPQGYVVGLQDSTALTSQPEIVTFALSNTEIAVQLPLPANDGAPAGPEFSNIVAFHPANQLVAIMSATTFSVVPANAGAPISGVANASTFAVDLEVAVNASHLDAYGKVLFDPTGGDLDKDGHLYMIVDANGIAGYQDGADYVIELFTTNNDLHLGHYI
jgi:hypothetical protein